MGTDASEILRSGTSSNLINPLRVGAVVIGRNEGERLGRCLKSVLGVADTVVYVDSGSTDGSIALARQLGVVVVSLDMSKMFTAARARNAGFARLRDEVPSIAFVQFVDGDCELIEGWIGAAVRYLDANDDVWCVCGRLRERFPEVSLYNKLCDIEWNRPTGEATACGGIAMMRRLVFEVVGGFNEPMIAGEEPELCFRIRQRRGRIWRLSTDMAWHDAGMTRFRQWWKRSARGGHAFAEGAYLHGMSPERYNIRETVRALLWGLVLPAAVVLLGVVDMRWAALALLYPLQVLRLATRYGMAQRIGWARALFTVLARFSETAGILKYCWNRLTRQRSALMEYK